MKPILEIYLNPLTEKRPSDFMGDYFTHYELQSVREYQSPDGTRFFEPCSSEEDMLENHPGGQAAGPALVGLYGRLNRGGVEHIADFSKVEDAREVLRRMGIEHP